MTEDFPPRRANPWFDASRNRNRNRNRNGNSSTESIDDDRAIEEACVATQEVLPGGKEVMRRLCERDDGNAK